MKGSSCKSGGKKMGSGYGNKKISAAKAGAAAKKTGMPKGAKRGMINSMKSGGRGA